MGLSPIPVISITLPHLSSFFIFSMIFCNSSGLKYFWKSCVPCGTILKVFSANNIVNIYDNGVREIVERNKYPPPGYFIKENLCFRKDRS